MLKRVALSEAEFSHRYARRLHRVSHEHHAGLPHVKLSEVSER